MSKGQHKSADEIVRGLLELIESAQEKCTRVILPDTDSHNLSHAKFVDRMVALMDGPFQRRVQREAREFLQDERPEVPVFKNEFHQGWMHYILGGDPPKKDTKSLSWIEGWNTADETEVCRVVGETVRKMITQERKS